MSTSHFEDVMLEDFKIQFPLYSENVVNWYAFDAVQLIIVLDDGLKILYDYIDKTIRVVRPERLNDITEDSWRFEFSQRLREKMQLRGLKQDTLSELSGMSRVMISNYITGKSTPSLYNAGKLAKALNCTVEDLLRFPK